LISIIVQNEQVKATYITGLDEIASSEQVLLVWRDLDVVGSNNWLIFLRVIETDRVVQVADVDGSNVVTISQGEVSELAVVGDVGVDGDVILGLAAKVDEELSDTLLAGRVGAEWVDDPDFTWGDSGSKSSRLGVAWDELDILDTTTLNAMLESVA
jgi:hypothetical protein